jgi:hypothetical protein
MWSQSIGGTVSARVLDQLPACPQGGPARNVPVPGTTIHTPGTQQGTLGSSLGPTHPKVTSYIRLYI